MKQRELTRYSILQRLSVAAAGFLLSLTSSQAADYPSTVLADGPVAYYRFEDTTNGGFPTMESDLSGNGFDATIYYNGEYTSPLLGQPGIESNSFTFQPGLASSDYGYVDVPNAVGLTPATGVGFSAELWVQPQGSPGAGGWGVPFEVGQYPNGWNFYVSGTGVGNGDTSYFYLDMRPGVFQGFGNFPITFYNWYHLVLTFDGTNAITYINGAAQATNNAYGFAQAPGVDGHIGSGQGVGWNPFIGGVDEFAFYTNVLSASQVALHYTVGSTNFRVITTPATVGIQPVSITNFSGTTASFTTLATGAKPLTYQWFSNSVAIPGATGTSISLLAEYPTNNNETFYVVVSNAYGAQTSTVVTLTVLNSLNLLGPPASITRNVGSYAAFHVIADGALPITYQWELSADGGNTFTPIAGATSPTLWLTNVTLAQDQNQYEVIVTNPFFTNTPEATLSVETRQDPPVPLNGYAAIVVADSPVAYWRLDETGGSLAEDAVGSFDGAYTPGSGTITYGVAPGIPHTSDTAVTLAGGATIQVPFAPELNSDTGWSVETWINPSSVDASNPNDYRVVLSSEYNVYPNPYNGWYLYQEPNGTLAFVPQPGNGFIFGNFMMQSNNWYHVVITDDTVNFTMYINGVEITGFPVSGDEFIPNGTGINPNGTAALNGDDGSSFVIGQRTDGAFNTFLGTVDDTAIYKYALSAAQIKSHYTASTSLSIAKSGSTGVVLTWKAGVLQASSSLTGTFTNVVGAASPYTTAASGTNAFYRLVVP